MDGGFRLYSADDMERVERIRQLKDLLGFSLAEIKEMLEADDVRLQVRAEWNRDADAAEKAARLRTSREVTLSQLNLLEQKMARWPICAICSANVSKSTTHGSRSGLRPPSQSPPTRGRPQ